jgi:hypothetical protein
LWSCPMHRLTRTKSLARLPLAGPTPRLLTMLCMLVVLGMMISVSSRPSTWRWLVHDAAEDAVENEGDQRRCGVDPHGAAAPTLDSAVAVASRETTTPLEALVSGPTDLDAEELAAAEREFEAVTDREPLAAEEMPAYWRLLRWSGSQAFDSLRSRGKKDVVFTQLWEQPDKHRGQPLTLRLHLVRTLEYDAPANRQGLKRVYEAWGTTNESQSFPYVVVFDQRPPGMPLGARVQVEATFAGYFLKTMAYTDGLGERRAAPLLIGRLKWNESAAPAAQRAGESEAFWITIAVGGMGLLLAAAVWARRHRSRHGAGRAVSSEAKSADVDVWLRAVEGKENEEEQECRNS